MFLRVRYNELYELHYQTLPQAVEALAALEHSVQQRDLSGQRMIKGAVTPEAIAEVVGRSTGIPISRLLSTEKQKLLRLESTLAKDVVGQPEAVSAVADAIRLARSGLANAGRPIASFLFAGSSGTGKTLLSKTVSRENT